MSSFWPKPRRWLFWLIFSIISYNSISLFLARNEADWQHRAGYITDSYISNKCLESKMKILFRHFIFCRARQNQFCTIRIFVLWELLNKLILPWSVVRHLYRFIFWRSHFYEDILSFLSKRFMDAIDQKKRKFHLLSKMLENLSRYRNLANTFRAWDTFDTAPRFPASWLFSVQFIHFFNIIFKKHLRYSNILITQPRFPSLMTFCMYI